MLTNAEPTEEFRDTPSEDHYTIICSGTFDSGTVTIDVSVDGTTWVEETGSDRTADFTYNLVTSAPYFRLKVTGDSGSASINTFVKPISI